MIQSDNFQKKNKLIYIIREKNLSSDTNKSTGLRGQVAGETELCTVGQSGTGLTYRGYEITDLAENAEFEEIAFLLQQRFDQLDI